MLNKIATVKQIAYCSVGTTFSLKLALPLWKKYVPYSVNVCRMNEICMYYSAYVLFLGIFRCRE